MKLCLSLRIVLLSCLVGWTVTQDMGFDLGDALDDDDPKPTIKPPEKPKVNGGGGGGGGGDFNLLDAFEDEKPKKPAAGDNDNNMGFDLEDALGPDPNPKPDPPAVVPPKSGGGGGGGSFDDDDLAGAVDGGYKPDAGHGGGGGRAPVDPVDPGDHAADQPQEAGSGQIAGIASAIGVAILGAASSYFAYQKKKLCFKLQGGVDPESGKGHQGTQSDPQVMSNLLSSS